MPPVNPSDIIEKQLALIQARSEQGALTYDETKALEVLIKLQIVLRMKAAAASGDEDPYSVVSSDDLKAVLAALKSDG